MLHFSVWAFIAAAAVFVSDASSAHVADFAPRLALGTQSIISAISSPADGAAFTSDHSEAPLSALPIKSTFVGITADAACNSQTAVNLQFNNEPRHSRSVVFSLTAIDQNLRLRI